MKAFFCQIPINVIYKIPFLARSLVYVLFDVPESPIPPFILI